jgi:hypothetical protein
MAQPAISTKLAVTGQAVKKADSRVKDSARWLLEFARIEYDKLSTDKQFTDLAAELIAVARREADDRLKAGVFDKFLNSPDMLKGSTMGEFHKWLKGQFEQAKADSWKTDDPNLMPVRTIDLFNIHGHGSSGDSFIISTLQCFKIAANRIIERERERFGICENPRCRNPFVAAIKARGKYCSPRCASYVNVMKSRSRL